MTPPKGDGVSLFYTSIVLLVLCWMIYIARAAVRFWKKTYGADDIVMLAGLLLFTVTSGLCIVCSWYGSGQLSAALSASDRMKGIKLFFIAEFFYASSAVTIKCSVAITLLRIAGSRRHYVWTIWGIMATTGISAIIFMIVIANICHPITTLWGETTHGSCNAKLNSDVSLFFSVVEIFTDWALAILPAILLWNIQMKARMKVSVACILGLAAFASCATIVRLRYLSLYSDPAEFMFATGSIGLWSIIETGMGIFAGSLGTLRPLLALPFFNWSSYGNSNNGSTANKLTMPKRSSIKMDTFQQLGDSSDKDADAESQKHILKETQVTVTSNERVSTPGEWTESQVLGWRN
ncbi:cation-transporting atpase 4 protein [Rutstroemia sp. NJR-2017a WRK4]|nr:cation-transporting atpase 4 protein [Rutstroemia sp. NJR-2017a WRK4]